jgi:hypothetical protein
MAAATYDILIEQGATFQLNLVYKDSGGSPIDISGYTARMQVRRSYDAPTALLDLTTENGAITLGGVAGSLVVEAGPTLTRDLPAKGGVYDLELVAPSGVVVRLIRGTATISPEVTK